MIRKQKGLALRGQAATEMLVVLAVVLVVALVTISLIGENIDTAAGVKASQSEIYWASQTPLSLAEMSAGAGTLSFVVKNSGAYPIQVKSITGNGATASVSTAWISPGESTVVSAEYSSLNPDSECSSSGSGPTGNLLIRDFRITYDQFVSAGGSGGTVTKTLVGAGENGLSLPCVSYGNGTGGNGTQLCGSVTCSKGEKCCEDGDKPLCIPIARNCDVCGGICQDESKTCCVEERKCVSQGEQCGAGTMCYEEVCSEKQECCDASQSCINMGQTCTLCGGCEEDYVCCTDGPEPVCIPERWECSECGGCEKGYVCCTDGPEPVCILESWECSECGGCDPDKAQCCNKGETPACIARDWVCDICGGCDPIIGACCTDDRMCKRNSEVCSGGQIACFGSLCDPAKQECCEKTAGCVVIGGCK